MDGFAGAAGLLADWPGLKRPQHLDLQQFLDVLCLSPLSAPAVLEVARRAHLMPYPPNWSEQVDSASGALYFYNDVRDEASWQHPMAETMNEVMRFIVSVVAERLNLGLLSQRVEAELARTQSQAAEELANWVGPIEASGADAAGAYYYHRGTGQSEWEDPRERWRFDIQVRYELLVGFLVAEERAVAAHFGAAGAEAGPPALTDLTPTLTSLASTLSSVASLLESSLTAPEAALAAQPAHEASATMWAQPRPIRRGGLPLPPRATQVVPTGRELSSRGSSGAGRNSGLFAIPPHQQRYASDVLQQDLQEARRSHAGLPASPPPPPGPPPPKRVM